MESNPLTNQKTLIEQQYKHTDNFSNRTQLHERFTITKEPWFPWVFRILDLKENQKILELGSGTGLLWKSNLPQLPENCEIQLTDLSKGMLKSIQDSITDDRFSIKEMDAQNITFEDHVFDTIIANHMLYHLPDLPKGLQEIKRVLKPEGKLLAATNGDNHMVELDDLLHEFDPASGFQRRVLPFNLENGANILFGYFQNVERFIHESYLQITEIKPLMAYYRSMQTLGLDFEQYDQQAFEIFLQSKLDQNGHIIIHKAQGLFVAKR